MSVPAPDEFRKQHAAAIGRLHASSHAARWALDEEHFASILHRSVEARFAGRDAAEGDVERFLDSLHVEDLALAAACERGDQNAWFELLENVGDAIRAAARLVTKDDARADELANEIYADLYGLEERDGRRRSLFSYFHGRSSLRTWLRSVLARNFVDAHRAAKRGDALRERLAGEIEREATTVADPPDPRASARTELLGRAFAAALGKLAARDRLRLASYYAQNLTLGAVGRILGEHESTVSRKLAETRAIVREEIEQILARESGLSPEEVRDCYQAAIDSGAFAFTKIAQDAPAAAFQD
jgi:RNA polymerase sigma factor (sigma-70 family)